MDCVYVKSNYRFQPVSGQLRWWSPVVRRVGYLPVKWSPGGQRRRRNLDTDWSSTGRIRRAALCRQRGRDGSDGFDGFDIDLGGKVRGIGVLMSNGRMRGGRLRCSSTGPIHTPLFVRVFTPPYPIVGCCYRRAM